MRYTKPTNSYGIVFDMFGKVPRSEIQILETTTTPKGIPKAIFKARLQTAKEKNDNGRLYEHDICTEIVNTLRPKAKGRSLFQEVDHPMVSSAGNDDFARRRAITVELKNCGTLIRDIYMEGNDVIGEIETLSGFMGPDIYNLVMYDGADIGYSLRMFGRVEMEESTGISRVVRPIRPITYDTVTNPSHKTARVLEFLPENISSFLTDSRVNSQLLQEGVLFNDNVELYDFNESVYDYLDRMIRDTFRSIGFVEFKIDR